MNILLLAEQIATRAHYGQYRRDGVTEYITHPAAIVKRLSNEDDDIKAIAWLHDVLEDTRVTENMLRKEGIPEHIIKAVKLLTKPKHQSYEFYLERIRLNPMARQVKIQDMLHNLSDSPTTKQILKYANGLLMLHADSVIIDIE